MRKLTFVITDDALFIRTVLRKMLEDIDGFTVIGEASNGFEAIEQARLKKPNIITLDITMPDMGGIEAIPKIIEASPKTKILMVSAMGQKSMVIEAITAGASDFVVKPFEKSRVMQAIKNISAGN